MSDSVRGGYFRRVLVERLEDRWLLSGMTSGALDNPHDVTVMSRNLYLGADLMEVFEAAGSSDPLAIPQAVGALWLDVQQRDFPARAEAFADEIAAVQPDLIGLQEVSLFVAYEGLIGEGTAPPIETIDYLEILLDELSDRGLQYTTAATTDEFGGRFPALVDSAFQTIDYLDRDVILARADLPAPALHLKNVQTGNFLASVPLNLGGVELEILRGWNSVDVQMWGYDFRFINTHLEVDDTPELAYFQTLQAQELVGMGGPAHTDLPVIMVGDFNSPADGSGTESYEIITAGAGFTDAWTVTHGSDPGYTWARNDDLRGDPVTADPPPAGAERIDLVLYRGADTLARDMERLMMPVEPSDPATGPFWPSDHAGVAATVSVQVTASGREMPWAVVNDDPLRPGEQSLFLVGTDRRDTVLVSQLRDGRVWGYVSSLGMRGVHELSAAGQVYANTAGGSDFVRFSPYLTRDTVTYAGAGNDRVFGGRGADVVYGGDGRDLLFGNGGADRLFGEDGPDYLFGGTGDDLLSGGGSRDVLFGQAGNDVLIGGAGIDWLFGGPGDDDLEDDGEDRLFG